MTLACNGAENTEKKTGRQNRQKPEPDHRCSFESAPTKIGVGWVDKVIEAGDRLMKLSAHAAN